MAGRQDEKKRQKRLEKQRRKKKQSAKQAAKEAAQRSASSGNLRQTLLTLKKLTEGESSCVIRLAAEGLSGEEIAQRIEISVEAADTVVEEFARLPTRVADLLVDNPSILENNALMKMILKVDADGARSHLSG